MTQPQERPYTFDRVVRIILTVVSIVAIFYAINLLKGALLPFVVAWLIAYLLNPIVEFFQRRICFGNRPFAIVVTLLSIAMMLTILGATLLPSIISEFQHTASVVENISKSSAFGDIVNKAWYQSLLEMVNLDELSKIMNPEQWTKIMEEFLTHTWSILSGSINQIINIITWFIVLLYLIFILLDYDNVIEGAKRLIPEQYREATLSILSDVERGMSRYFRGQSLIALSVGILFSIGFVIVGLPLAIPVGIFVGLLNLVPYLQIIGFIPIILLCLLDTYTGGTGFWSIFGSVLIVFAIVQSFQDLFLVPRIMGRMTGFSPAVILLSLSVWGSLMGIMGMIIALPITSVLVSYYQKYILKDSSS